MYPAHFITFISCLLASLPMFLLSMSSFFFVYRKTLYVKASIQRIQSIHNIQRIHSIQSIHVLQLPM